MKQFNNSTQIVDMLCPTQIVGISWLLFSRAPLDSARIITLLALHLSPHPSSGLSGSDLKSLHSFILLIIRFG